MKRLLGLLLVMGMVGCGDNENAGNAVAPSIGADEQLVTESGGEKSDPSNPNVKVDEPPVQTVDASKLVTRDGLRYEVDSETPFTGVVVAKHENGQKKGEGTLKDGKPEGLKTAWYENGKKESESIWKDGKAEGLATAWYESGQKKHEGTFKDGKPEGLVTTWHANGQKQSEATFKDGKPEGLTTMWHENGQKSLEATYKDGKKVSETMWDDEGNIDPVAALEKLRAKITRNEQGEVVNVNLSGTQITDAGLAHIKGMTRLQHLHLGQTKITDAGLVHLKGLTNLQALYLGGQVTDAGLVHLEGLTNLQALGLRGTKVTNAGLVHLAGLTNLTFVDLGETQVTDAGVAELQQALPNCRISSIARPANGKAYIAKYDTDSDGKVSKEEFKAHPETSEQMKSRIDSFWSFMAGDDGFIDEKEADSMLKRHRERGSGSGGARPSSEDTSGSRRGAGVRPVMPANGRAYIKKYDTDGDGTVSKEEFKAHPETSEQMKSRIDSFWSFMAGDDGVIDEKEADDMLKRSQNRGRGGARPSGEDASADTSGSRGGGRGWVRLKKNDSDGDGKISKDEAPEHIKRFFDRMDKNKDGVIEESEVGGRRGGGDRSGGVPSFAALKELGAQIQRNSKGEVVAVHLFGTQITDAGLVHLKGLTNLADLNLYRTQVTDAGLVHLNGMANLVSLDLLGSQVTDAGLVHLVGLNNLKDLGLNFTQVTGTGLVHLKELTSLEKLWLRHTQITDARLVHLKGLTNLQNLSLSNNKITGTGLVHLEGMNNLEVLSLSNTQMTEEGLVHLKGLANLKTLSLLGTQITDAGLVHLTDMASLELLLLDNTQITDAGFAELQKALPNCKITK